MRVEGVPAEGGSAFPPRDTFPDCFSFDTITSNFVASDSTTSPVCSKLDVIQRGSASASAPGWLVGWSIFVFFGWLVVWLVDWLVGRLVCLFVCWLVGWLVG